MRRPSFRIVTIAIVASTLIAGLAAVLVVRPRVPILGIGPACVLEPADRGFRRVDTLRRIALFADGSALAVGSRYSGAVGQPIAFRWRDGAWRPMDVPSVSEKVTSGLHDVAAFGADAWAVGSIRARTPLAVRWDGEGWSDVPTDGLAEDAEAEWLGVAATRAGGVLAVGKILDGLAYRTLVGRLDAGRFVAERGPNVGDGNNVFADVDLRGASAWAVGWTVGPDGVYRTLAARFADGAWVVEPTPDPGVGDDVLSTVAVVDADTAWAVGWSRDGEGEPTPLVLRWDGATWRAVRPPAAAGRLLAVAATGGRLVVAGDVMDDDRRQVALAYARVDGAWEEIPTPDPQDRWYTGLALVGEADALAVGPQVVGGRYGSFLATGC